MTWTFPLLSVAHNTHVPLSSTVTDGDSNDVRVPTYAQLLQVVVGALLAATETTMRPLFWSVANMEQVPLALQPTAGANLPMLSGLPPTFHPPGGYTDVHWSTSVLLLIC